MRKDKISVKIFRYDPSIDQEPRYEEYQIPYRKNMTVLDTLRYINENIEPIAFRYECRYGTCGSCAVMFNGKPVLACQKRAEDDMRLDPLPIFPVIKDLVVDDTSYYEKRQQLRPYLDRTKPPKEFPEEEVTYELDQIFKEYVECIDCHLCEVVCPVLGKEGFIGPALMTYMAWFAQDPRDETDRVNIALAEGLEVCTNCGKCDEICPKNVQPMEKIERLRNMSKNERK